MNAHAEWTERHDDVFAEAVKAIAEDVAENDATVDHFETSLEHYASLFSIDAEALRHEWNLRMEDCR